MSPLQILTQENIPLSDIKDLSVREVLRKTLPYMVQKHELDSLYERLLFDVEGMFSNLNNKILSIERELDYVKNIKKQTINITLNNSQQEIDLGVVHKQFNTLLNIVKIPNLHVYLVGGAGSGKTYAVEAVAKTLGLDFYFTGRIASEFKLIGYMDANGNYVSTAFRNAFEHGGLFLFDEIDASDSRAVISLNAALSSGCMDFPDSPKPIKAHKDFRCVATANTLGYGASLSYIAREPLDLASKNRFITLNWEYDPALELSLASNYQWANLVIAFRTCITELNLRYVISYRNTINGDKLLQFNEIKKSDVLKFCLISDIDDKSLNLILNRLNSNYPDLYNYYMDLLYDRI